MKLYDLITSRRTIREFQDRPIARKGLEKFVNAGRLAPQAANRQPLEFIIVDDLGVCSRVFPLIRLGGLLEWKPTLERQPRAYIAVVVNERLQKPVWVSYDVALASGNICLAAWEDGIGSCLIGAFNKAKLEELLRLPNGYSINLLVALGYPAHRSVVEEKDCIEYWRDEDGTFHVPKRPLGKVMHYNRF